MNSSLANYIAETLPTNSTKIVLLDFAASKMTTRYYESLLSKDEVSRLNKITLDSRRKQFIITRAITRTVIADTIQAAHSDIEFALNEYGKPYCSRPKNVIHFNISHSNDFGIIALNCDHKTGIDIQHQRPQKQILKLAKRFFASEEIQLLEQSGENQLNDIFYRIWARKEALLKSTGTGLAHGLSRYTVVTDKFESAHCLIDVANCTYYISDIPAPDQYSAALATHNSNPDIVLNQWQHPE